MYELHVDGMTCGGCANSVKRAVQSIDPAAKVDVDLAGKKVRIESAAHLNELAAAITEAGYTVAAANPGVSS